MNTSVEKLLTRVQKPGRYTGGELNSIIKPEASFRMAISYPDLYEVGMSNNGIKILYDRVNSLPGFACERVFAVEKDFEDLLREEDVCLYSLETFTPLKDLDLLGFNISHELLATNVLQILDLGRIPIFRKDRSDTDPVVVAGGSSVSNPLPLFDFIDLFFIGDGEEGLVEIGKIIERERKNGLKREQLLEKLEAVDGVLIPENYEIKYSEENIVDIKGPVVRKRIYSSKIPSDPEKPVIPSMRITQDRAVVEITRGCRNLCKFCHAGYYDLPYRVHSQKTVGEKLLRVIENTGYNEVSFSSLSVSDYRYLIEVLNDVLPGLTERGISISLPSLRVDRESIPLIEGLSDVRKTSLTFAVESASEELRKRADKKVDIDDLFYILQEIFRKGWKVVKLYFMIGLPGCEEIDEAEEIIELLTKIKAMAGKSRQINITVSPFIPKTHTPFQNEKQMDMDYLSDTILRIKRGLPRSISVKNHNVKSSCLEGVFSRGDTRLGQVIYQSYKSGCRFDSWREHFRFDIWKENLDTILPFWEKWFDPRPLENPLPWSIVETGFETISEARKDFRREDLSVYSKVRRKAALDTDALERSMEAFTERYETVSRIRVRLSKKNTARFISHLDFMDVIRRGFRMVDLPFSYTQGFNKHEKVSSGFPSPLGIESEAELCDIELYREIDQGTLDNLSSRLPDGIDLLDWHYIEKSPSLMGSTVATEYRIEADDEDVILKLLDLFSRKPDLIKNGKKGQVDVDFTEAVLDVKRKDSSLMVTTSTGTVKSIRILDIIKQLDHGESFAESLIITKTAQFGKGPEGLYIID